jgi:hypothetical protein
MTVIHAGIGIGVTANTLYGSAHHVKTVVYEYVVIVACQPHQFVTVSDIFVTYGTPVAAIVTSLPHYFQFVSWEQLMHVCVELVLAMDQFWRQCYAKHKLADQGFQHSMTGQAVFENLKSLGIRHPFGSAIGVAHAYICDFNIE